jgi:hypothetical protein
MVIVFASCEVDLYRTCDVMVIVFASCEADREFDFGRVKLGTMQLVFAASSLSTQY